MKKTKVCGIQRGLAFRKGRLKMDITINAPAEKIAELEERMKSDGDFLKEIADDPSAALAPYGIEMDEETEAAVKAHFESIVAPGPGASPVSVAVAVGLAVALAIPHQQ
ncbi:hypothetical protein [Palleronia caenipelagi]|uniref:Uncharacterized protein n=1 Tax=Palleronia caenipelagi TaxID=2489174 RepID=A0A547PJD9_9RHOB|nr:hypothetical protein [Palleronia caenipelagi]TRD14262.1 hypothetical protein FEV53_19290 [Palleronia caenipelagi]